MTNYDWYEIPDFDYAIQNELFWNVEKYKRDSNGFIIPIIFFAIFGLFFILISACFIGMVVFVIRRLKQHKMELERIEEIQKNNRANYGDTACLVATPAYQNYANKLKNMENQVAINVADNNIAGGSNNNLINNNLSTTMNNSIPIAPTMTSPVNNTIPIVPTMTSPVINNIPIVPTMASPVNNTIPIAPMVSPIYNPNLGNYQVPMTAVSSGQMPQISTNYQPSTSPVPLSAPNPYPQQVPQGTFQVPNQAPPVNVTVNPSSSNTGLNNSHEEESGK